MDAASTPKPDAALYLAQHECALSRNNPHLLAALATDDLEDDQRMALYRALGQLRIPSGIGAGAVSACSATLACWLEEAAYLDAEVLGNISSKIARMVAGSKERRDDVRARLGLALRAWRIASSN